MKIKLMIFVVSLLTSCSNSIDDLVVIRQIESIHPIILRADTVKGIFTINYPLSYKIRKKKIGKIELYVPLSYFWNSSDLITRKGRRTTNITPYKIENNTLSRLKFNNENLDLSFFKSKEYVFYTDHPIDTIPEAQALFKPYLEKMKRLGQDTLHIGSIQTLNRTTPELTYDFLKGDSIDMSFFYNKIVIDKYLPVEVK